MKFLIKFISLFIFSQKNKKHFLSKWDGIFYRREQKKNENIIVLSKQLKVVEKLLLEQNIKNLVVKKQIGNATFYGDNDVLNVYKEQKRILTNELICENVSNGLVFNCGLYNEYSVYYENLSPVLLSDTEASGCNFRDNNIDWKQNKDFRKIKFKEIDEEVIFLGACIYHYGHTLLGTINRLYFLQDEKYKNKKFVLLIKKDSEKMLEFFRLVGIKDENIIQVKLGEGYKFRNIIVPACTSFHIKKDMTENVHKRFMENVATINRNLKSDSNIEKIYLTRIKADGSAVEGQRLFGEQHYIDIFRKNGFTIICPDEYPILEQLKMFRNCKVLASVSGSALHNSIFLKDDAEVICIGRGFGIPIQGCFDYLKGIKATYIFDSIISANSKELMGAGNCFCFVNRNFQQYLDDNHMIYVSNDLMFDTEQYKEYMNSCKLEKQKF